MSNPTPEGKYLLDPVCSLSEEPLIAETDPGEPSEAIFPYGDKSLEDWIIGLITRAQERQKACVAKEGAACPRGCAVAGLARIQSERLVASLIEAGKLANLAKNTIVIINSPKDEGDGGDKDK